MTKEYHLAKIIVVGPQADHKQVVLDFLGRATGFGSAPKGGDKPTVAGAPKTTDIIFVNDQDTPLSIDMVRNMLFELSYGVATNQTRNYVILRADLASNAAQNALLRTLEEPPASTNIILTTSSPRLLLPTITSRKTGDDLDSAMTDFWQKSEVAPTFSALIELAESFKDKAEAINFVKMSILYLHQKMAVEGGVGNGVGGNEVSSSENGVGVKKQAVFVIQQLHTALAQLEKNCNVKLTMESCLFAIKKNSNRRLSQ
jgi:hypothetical protein